MTTRTHPLFQRYPLTGQASLSTGPAPTPYHIYDGIWRLYRRHGRFGRYARPPAARGH